MCAERHRDTEANAPVLCRCLFPTDNILKMAPMRALMMLAVALCSALCVTAAAVDLV